MFIMLFFVSGIGFSAENPAELRISKINDVGEHFMDPPAAYRPAPLYVWNDDMQEEELASQLDEFKAQGYGGVFVHPRPGLITPYLSERWLEMWRFTADESKKRGMVTYIYDENSYPSGFAGGHVPENLPNVQQASLNRKQYSADQMDQISVSANTEGLYRIVDEQNGEYERVALPEITQGEKSAKDLGLKSGSYIQYDIRFSQNAPWYGNRTYVDLMNPKVADEFIKVTLGAYDSALSDLYGNQVLACFTDEPQVAGCWSPVLAKAFEKRWGYDILDHLPSIHADLGDWRKIRHDYAVTILDLFMNNFAKPYYEACEKRGLPTTGHIWEHGWPNASHNPDVMSYNSWQHWPGIDCLMNQYSEGPGAQFGNYRASKEISSIANQFGRVRKLCETYGAGGWELTIEDMKRIGDFLYVGGINLMNPHLSYYTIRGARKRDHPQSFSYHAPYWEAYHISMDYFGRLSWALSAGKERNPILVIEPTTSGWPYNWSATQGDALNKLGVEFQKYSTDLASDHVSYDLGSEPVMADHAKVKGKNLVIGECKYQVVVLPPGLDNLESATIKLLNKFAKNGGTIISYVGTPPYVDGQEDDAAQEIKKIAGKRWIEKISNQQLKEDWGNPKVTVNSKSPSGERVFHYLRELDDANILFVTNTSITHNADVEMNAQGRLVEEWNLVDGTIHTVDFTQGKKDAKASINWSAKLYPAGSAMYVIYPKKKGHTDAIAKIEYSTKPLKAVGDLSIAMQQENALPLDYVDLVLNGETTEGLYFYQAQNKIYKAHGFNGNPWDSAVQFKDELIKKDKFPKDSGFELRYPFVIGDFSSSSDLKLVVERGDRYQVKINGAIIEPEKDQWWLDHFFNVYILKSDQLKKGRNVITTIASPFTLHHEPESVYLVGDFNLKSAVKGWSIEKPSQLELGSWAKQGKPHYAHQVSYTQKFQCDGQSKAHYVALDEWEGTAARVDVNGETAGYIGWQPWQLDISDQMKSGENTITVTVFGSLKNLLGPYHNGSGRGAAWPGMFRNGPKEGQPSGEKYDVMDYGLYKPFKVY